jgi:hypothetical protein
MVDSLAAKIGIGEAARRDPVGVRVRSPSQKTPQNNSLSPQRSVNQRRQAPAHGRFRNPKTAEFTRCREIELPRCRSGSMWGRFFLQFIRLDCWCNMVNAVFGHHESAALACPEASRQDRARGRCSAIIVSLCCFPQWSSWWENALNSCGRRRQ